MVRQAVGAVPFPTSEDGDDMMELDFDDSVVRGLHHYVRLVSQALRLRGGGWYVHAESPASAYIALDGRLSRFPDRDVALLWEETHGWSAAIETHSGEDLLAVAYLDQDVLPPPEAVAAWVRQLFHPHRDMTSDRHPDAPPAADVGATRQRLAAYAGPVLATMSSEPHARGPLASHPSFEVADNTPAR